MQNHSNGKIKSSDNKKILEKAILAGIGVASSKELVKKAIHGIYDDIQKILNELVDELEVKGELKTKETKDLLKQIQERSDKERKKLFKELKVDSKNLIDTAKEFILKPFTKTSTVKTKAKSKAAPAERKKATKKSATKAKSKKKKAK